MKRHKHYGKPPVSDPKPSGLPKHRTDFPMCGTCKHRGNDGICEERNSPAFGMFVYSNMGCNRHSDFEETTFSHNAETP